MHSNHPERVQVRRAQPQLLETNVITASAMSSATHYSSFNKLAKNVLRDFVLKRG